jgi:hypothetical protein
MWSQLRASSIYSSFIVVAIYSGNIYVTLNVCGACAAAVVVRVSCLVVRVSCPCSYSWGEGGGGAMHLSPPSCNQGASQTQLHAISDIHHKNSASGAGY